jgi:hypothetical protein
MKLRRLCLKMTLVGLLAMGSVSIAAAQDTQPSRMDKIKASLKHNKEKVRACRKEAIDKNIPPQDRATYEQECQKKTK